MKSETNLNLEFRISNFTIGVPLCRAAANENCEKSEPTNVKNFAKPSAISKNEIGLNKS